MVEAAIVMPLVILMAVSMISLMIYFYAGLESQVDLHKEAVSELIDEEMKTSFEVFKISSEVSEEMKGLSSLILHKTINAKAYKINESRSIRLKESF